MIIEEYDASSGVSRISGDVREHSLYLASSNPFRAVTTIVYELPRPEGVTIRVYDIGGRVVRSLVALASKEAGSHEVRWDGCDSSRRRVSSGIYFCRMEAGTFTHTEKILLAR